MTLTRFRCSLHAQTDTSCDTSLLAVVCALLQVLYSTEPVWAAAFANLVLGEAIGVNTVVGGALIISACISSAVRCVLLPLLAPLLQSECLLFP